MTGSAGGLGSRAGRVAVRGLLHGGLLQDRSERRTRSADPGGKQRTARRRLETGQHAMQNTDRMSGPGQHIQSMQTIVRGQQVDIIQRPMLTAGLFARHLRLGLADPGSQIALPLTTPRHQRRDREPQHLFRTHHEYHPSINNTDSA